MERVIVNGEEHFVNPNEDFIELCNMAEEKNDRITNSSDVQINRKLFSLLRKGYDALTEAISRNQLIKDKEEEIKQAGTSRFRGGYGVWTFIVIGIIMIVSFCYIWEKALDELYETYPESSGYYRTYDRSGSKVTTSEGDVIVDQIRKTRHPIIARCSHFYIWIIFSGAATYIIYYLMKKKAQENGRIAEARLRPIIELEREQLRQYIIANAEYIVLMPEDYRDPDHMKELLHLYEVGKADTLKECMNLLDTIEFRSNLTSQLSDISRLLSCISAQLEDAFYY